MSMNVLDDVEVDGFHTWLARYMGSIAGAKKAAGGGGLIPVK